MKWWDYQQPQKDWILSQEENQSSQILLIEVKKRNKRWQDIEKLLYCKNQMLLTHTLDLSMCINQYYVKCKLTTTKKPYEMKTKWPNPIHISTDSHSALDVLCTFWSVAREIVCWNTILNFM